VAVDTDQDEFLTVADVANRLKLNQQTIYNWIDRGQLPAVRVGARRVRVRRSDLDAVLAAGETQGRSTEADAAWTDIRSAISDARRAANRHNEPALRQAMASLANALERLNTKTEGDG
jgi:excisionase family DNA binding protein